MQRAGYEVLAAHDGREALALFGATRRLDVFVMDIGLPDADGRDVVTALKSAGQHAPVLFLTALGETHHLVAGFAAGAEEYVVKPSEITEILLRLEALTRRGSADRFRATGLVLDPIAHAARTEDGEVPFSPTESSILAVITSRPGEVVRRRSVVAAAWPDGAIVSDDTVDSFVRRIRTKLASIGSPASVKSVRGGGFTIS